jgi:hypothetical protein
LKTKNQDESKITNHTETRENDVIEGDNGRGISRKEELITERN